MMHNCRRSVLAAVLVAILLAPMRSDAATVTVSISGGSFVPSLLKSAIQGDTVRFNLVDGVHDAVSYAGGPFNSGTLSSSRSSYSFAYGGGNIYYRCTLHSSLSSSKVCSGMCGVITDQTSAPSVPVVSSPTDGATIDVAPMPISGSGTPLTRVVIYEGTKTLASAIVGSDGTWSASVVFPSVGSHTIHTRGFQPDPAVAPSAFSSSITLNVTKILPDTYKPYVELYLASETWVSPPVISGFATDNPSTSLVAGRIASVQYTLTNVLGLVTTYAATCSACPATSVYWNGTPRGLLPGRYTVRAMATDEAGNVGMSGTGVINVLALPAS